jgi:prepilin-type N-terminal cleavage/methylation domain-containing protein
MKHRAGGFSLVELMITIAISAVLIVAVWAVVAAVVKTDDNSRIRVEMQLEAATALRKISDLLKMAGPTGNMNTGWTTGDYPVFAVDRMGGGFPSGYDFLNSTNPQSSPGGPAVTNDAVAHLAPVADATNFATLDPDRYYGTSNEIAFKLPRPGPWYAPGALPGGKQDNPTDMSGAPVDINGAVTWGVSSNLYQYYMGAYAGAGYIPVVNPGTDTADRQTDVYAIVLVPTTSVEKDATGAMVAGPNQLELREYSSQYSAQRFLIRRTVLAYNVERIVFKGPVASSRYYLMGGVDPLTGESFQDASLLGANQLSVTIWMWRNSLDRKSTQAVNAYRVKQSMTVNLRSVGQNQGSN